jgi:DNA-binding CsgD family transcriptional regulator
MLISNNMIIEQFPGLLVWKDINSTFLGGNEAFSKSVGFNSVAELVGNSDFSMPCEASECAKEIVAQDKKVLESRTPLEILDIHHFFDGEQKIMLTKKSPLIDQSGSVLGVICFLTEITNNILTNNFFKLINNSSRRNMSYVLTDDRYSLSVGYEKLTRRELECVYLLLQGKTARSIAEILYLSPRTIENHLLKIREKFYCDTKADLIEKFYDMGLLNILPKSIFRKYFIK